VVVVQKVVERLRYRTWLRSSRVSRGALSHRLALAEGRLNFLEWTVTEFRKRSGPQAGGPWGPLPADGDEIDRFNNAARELGEDAGVAYEVAGFDAPADARDLLASFRHKASRLSGFTAEYDPRRMGSPWRWLTQVEFNSRRLKRTWPGSKRAWSTGTTLCQPFRRSSSDPSIHRQ